jgi:molecular chaperone Hsp33
MAEGVLVRGLVLGGRARVLAVVADSTAQEIVRAHGLAGAAARICTQGVVATLLMSAHIKDEERLMVQVQASKPRFAFHGEARADGSVRARLSPTWFPETEQVEGALLAIKWDGDKELYRGVAELKESFEASLQEYLVSSQQTHGVVRLQVKVDEDGRVRVASGLLVEMLGGQMEAAAFEPLVRPLRSANMGEVMTGFAFGQLLGGPVEVLESRPVTLRRTTLARVEGMLRGLGAAELRAMAEEQGEASITCQFTNETFTVGKDRLIELAEGLEG